MTAPDAAATERDYNAAQGAAKPRPQALRAKEGVLFTEIDRYLARELARPFLFYVVVLTGLVWLSQSLRVVDTVVNNAQSAPVFLEFTALLLPRAMALVLPLAAFMATLQTVNRLFSESEIVAMLAGGLSAAALARPVLLFGALVMAAMALVTWLGAPLAEQRLRDRVAQVRGDIVSGLLFEGQFLNPASGLTVYVRQTGAADGGMRGVMVHDRRDPAAELTYSAREAILRRTEEGPRLVMADGAAQRRDMASGAVTLLRFDSLVFDLSQFMQEETDRERKPSERFLTELLWADPAEVGGALGRFRAEGHEQLSGPLYALTLPLVALATIVGAGFTRRGYLARVGLALALGAALRVSGLAAKAIVVTAPAAWPLLYIPPLLGAAAAMAYLSRGGWGARRRTGGAATAAAGGRA
jgi:lipopolysaccharide export system permease protein